MDGISRTIDAKLAEKKEDIQEVKEIGKDLGFAAEYEKMADKEKIEAYYKAIVAHDTAKLKVMSVGSTADGGFLVPTILFNEIVQEQRDFQIIRPLARVISNCPSTLNVDQLVGRPISKFRAEKALKDTSTATFAQISLTPYSLACIVVMTNELIEDSVAGGPITSLMTELIAKSIAEREEKAFAIGSGTTEPTGINAYAATVHRIYATPANVLTADSLIQAFYGLGQNYRKRAVWLMNSVTLTKARQLKDSQNRYLFIPDPNQEMAGTILGRPVYEQNDLPAANIWFGDVKGYWIGDRGTMSVKYSEEATIEGVGNLFEKNMTAIRVEKRVDGELADLDSFCVITGTN
jgi:HK97 family phage major capsid protein